MAYGLKITFVDEKNHNKDDYITNINTGDCMMNLVKMYPTIICCLCSIPSTTDDTPICSYFSEDDSLP